MTKYFLLFFSLILSCCQSKDEAIDHFVDSKILEFSKKLDEGLHPVGIGGGINHANGKRNLFIVRLSTSKDVRNLECARKIFVQTLCSFISFLNEDVKLRDYISDYPISIDNVKVGIIFENAQVGEIVNVSNYKHYLFYRAVNKDPDSIPWVEVCEETFEEALKIVNESKK